VVQFAPLVQRQVLPILDVRFEVRLAVVQGVRELGPDAVGLCLELRQPGKFAAVVELDWRQSRVVILVGRVIRGPELARMLVVVLTAATAAALATGCGGSSGPESSVNATTGRLWLFLGCGGATGPNR